VRYCHPKEFEDVWINKSAGSRGSAYFNLLQSVDESIVNRLWYSMTDPTFLFMISGWMPE